MRIACLHTIESNVAAFDSAASELGLSQGSLHHQVHADLRVAAETAGALTPAIARKVGAVLMALGRDADAVVLTCSTVGGVVEVIRKAASVPVLRADHALVDAAVRYGGKVVALCAAEASVKPTGLLLSEAGKRRNVELEVRIVRTLGLCSRAETLQAVCPQSRRRRMPLTSPGHPSSCWFTRGWRGRQL